MPDLAPGEALRIGAGIIRGKKLDDETETEVQDFGEFSAFAVSSEITKLKYKSNKLGAKSVVKTKITEKAATIEITLNSVTARNMAIALGGDVEEVAEGHKRFGYLKNNVTRLLIQIEGTNDDGDMVDYTGIVEMAPTGTYSPISEEWNELPMSGDVIADANGNFGFWDIREEGVAYDPPDLEATA